MVRTAGGERVRFTVGAPGPRGLLTNTIWSFEEEGITNDVRTGAINHEQAIEEALRYRSPIQPLKRIATENVELNGQQIQTGDVLTLWLGAANRDPEIFDDPEKFRPERGPNRHIAFGTGVHFCLGAHLARMEADVAIEQLLERFVPAGRGFIESSAVE